LFQDEDLLLAMPSIKDEINGDESDVTDDDNDMNAASDAESDSGDGSSDGDDEEEEDDKDDNGSICGSSDDSSDDEDEKEEAKEVNGNGSKAEGSKVLFFVLFDLFACVTIVE